MIVGNDIASYQGDVNYDIYKNNSNFLIAKASEGVGFTDPKFSRNQTETRKVGLPRGWYHFARPDLGNSAQKEAEWFCKVVGALQEGEVPVLDYEVTWGGDKVMWCKDWLNFVAKILGCKPLIYLNQDLIKNSDWTPVVNEGFGLWVAAYTGDPNLNNANIGAWHFAAMQQWTSSQMVPGIVGKVDGDVFFGDVAGFKKYGWQKPVVTPPPTPDPVPPTPTPEPPTPPVDPTPTPTPVPTPTPAEVKLSLIKDIVWGKGWPWTKVNKLKVLLPK
jgi:lysozyme